MDDSETSVTDLSVSPESAAIAVGGGGVGGVQICPAIMLGSSQALPGAAKHIYSRLAANAAEVDEGMPSLIVSLVSNGNQLSEKYLSRFQAAISVLISGGGLWLISSGEHHDPLARSASSALRAVLPQTERDVEVLHVIVNSMAVTAREEGRLMVDASLNTLLLLSRNLETDEEPIYRANAVVKLAHPPPDWVILFMSALLIGVPSENIASGTTPSGSAPPILLSPSNDRRPLPAVVFAGASLSSLQELLVYVENGFPIIVLQDSCELCVILHSAYLLYRSPHFDHSKFVDWLEEQLDAVFIEDVTKTTDIIVRIFATAFGDNQLIEFLDSDEMPSLASRIIELCLQCHSGSTEAHQLLQLSAHINEPSILNEVDLDDLLDDELMTAVLCEAIAVENRVAFLAAILERRPQISISSEMLRKMARNSDQSPFAGGCAFEPTYPYHLPLKRNRPRQLCLRWVANRNELEPSLPIESATPQSMVFPLNIEDVDGEDAVFAKKPRISRRAPPSLCLFYSTPIVKYWLSLLFRLLHIALLAYSVGSATWLWKFNIRCHCMDVDFHSVDRSGLGSQHEEPHDTFVTDAVEGKLDCTYALVFDCVVTLIFLFVMLLFKFVGDSPISDFFMLSSVYPVRVFSAFFLLYWCYATIFFYIPLSELFGPIVVRVKLMILRDFTNFLILVALVMSSSAAAIHAVLYPDRDISISVVRSSLSWVWLSLFTTDLSTLRESDTCKKSFLGSPTSYCGFIGEYGNTSCPSQSSAGYLVVLEYFVLLKLILWPVLFAFFAKTAKSVDDEADKIWKFQMYSLVTEFRYAFGFVALSGITLIHPNQSELVKYYDRRYFRGRSTVRFGSVYRNPSVPAKKNEFVNSFWRQLMIDRWKDETQTRQQPSGRSEVKTVQKQLRMLALSNSYAASGSRSRYEVQFVQYADTEIKRLAVAPAERPWQVLLPRYAPTFYCRPAEEFSADAAKHVEVATEQNVTELRRMWRARQAMETGKGWMLSAAGYPLNPHGRRGAYTNSEANPNVFYNSLLTGIAGRGCHPRFGANIRCYYIILIGTKKSDCKLLLDSQHNLPNEPHPESGSKDEHLASLLRTVGLPESDAQVFSMRRLDSSIVDSSETVPSTDTSPAHIARFAIEHDIDTDHAWTEHDLWAISLRNRKVLNTVIGYFWHPLSSPTSLSATHTEMLNKTLRVYGIV
ncbi:hypothetical protein OESDEN_08214 [Oesophagostomum dentatum]|uniref:Uncharacterized protein n=1 Tax=Oesophagostomum dentatum TaxID=61180 RepID=A0A0B1T6Y3_OESDE|nr:hypothetical protein OESDEN_08214 [Oesophagostomum dentatum]